MSGLSRHPLCTCIQSDTSTDLLAKLQPYQYRELDTQPSTRIFELLPGNSGDPLRGRLRQIQLDDDLDSYTALSYAWGVTLKTQLIECGGRSLQINCNLFSALTRLRDEEEQRTLPIFVDALIINQSVEPEGAAGTRSAGQVNEQGVRAGRLSDCGTR
jgi:Heterokaryon incompatibility protein (HET)